MIDEEMEEEHLTWKNRPIDKEKIREQEQETQTPACCGCLCLGNQECGHDCFDEEKLCTLQPNMLCPCCNEVKEYEHKKGV